MSRRELPVDARVYPVRMGVMRRVWACVVSFMLVLGLVLAEAPRLCPGDGHGSACVVGACHCDATCTCHLEHEEEAAAQALADASLCGRPMDAARQHLKQLAGACHGGHHGPNIAIPMKQWTASLPVLPVAIVMGRWREATALASVVAAARALAPLEHPPRPLV